MSASDASKNQVKPSEKPAEAQQKPAAQLEEDDEFEDFPVEDWAKEDEVGSQQTTSHLWEESWDDDDTSDDFSVQLRAEMEKIHAKKG